MKEYFTPWKLSSWPRWTVAVQALTGQDRYIQKAFQLFSNSSKTLSAPRLGCREWEGSLSKELSLVSIYLHNYLAVNGCVTGRRVEVVRGPWKPGRAWASWVSTSSPFVQTVHFKCQVKKAGLHQISSPRSKIAGLGPMALEYPACSLKGRGRSVATPACSLSWVRVRKKEGGWQQEPLGHRGAKILCKSEDFKNEIIKIYRIHGSSTLNLNIALWLLAKWCSYELTINIAVCLRQTERGWREKEEERERDLHLSYERSSILGPKLPLLGLIFTFLLWNFLN